MKALTLPPLTIDERPAVVQHFRRMLSRAPSDGTDGLLQGILKAVSDNPEITEHPELLTVAHQEAFSTQEVDFENDDHMVLWDAVQTRYRQIVESSDDVVPADPLGDVKDFLRRSGFEPGLFDRASLIKVDAGMRKHTETLLAAGISTAEAALISFVRSDDLTGMFVTPDGEVLGYQDLTGIKTPEELFTELGERLAWLDAKKTGQEAAKKAMIDKVNAAYDPAINRLTRSIDWAKKGYRPLAEQHIEEHNKALVEKGKKPVKHLDYGLCRIQLTSQKESTPVDDHEVAIKALRALYLDEEGPWFGDEEGKAMVEGWIKKTESILVSNIPSEVKESIDVPGISYIPAGDVKCEIK